MTPEFVIDFSERAMELTLLLSLPLLLIGLVVGLIVSVFQATTQIQEMTLQFIPKILAIMAGMLIFAPWMLSKLMTFTESTITGFPEILRLGADAMGMGIAP